MPRYSSPYTSSFSFGPGPVSSAIKAIIGINVVMFLATTLLASARSIDLIPILGLRPVAVIHQLWVWQPVTYMFLHGGLLHILFNMLALWMFGTELERIWGTRYFVKFYLATGIGAGVLTILVSLLGFAITDLIYVVPTIGASGAIYGLLLAYAMYFPDRPIYMYFLFPVPAKIFVAIMGAIAFYASIVEAGGVANATHLGGLLVGYAMLKGSRLHPMAELKYRYLKWRINRVRKKFDVYSGGRADDVDRRVH
jgi:membrane associated rhomboid family serine protease